MLVNEAIIDVAVGAAKFRGEYTYCMSRRNFFGGKQLRA